MVETVLTALAPVVVTLLLGFAAACHQDFGVKDAAVLNRMVLLYAVPVTLFVGTVGTPRGVRCCDVRGHRRDVHARFSALPLHAPLLAKRERIGGISCLRAGRAIHGTGYPRRPPAYVFRCTACRKLFEQISQ